MANLANKKIYHMIDLETKLRVIRDYGGGKLVKVIARQSGMSPCTIALILKSNKKMIKLLKNFLHGRQ